MRIESRWGLPQKPKLESLNVGKNFLVQNAGGS